MSLVVLLTCHIENFEWLWEKRLVFQAPKKTSLGHLGAVKQLTTVALDMKRWKVDPGAFQSLFGHFQNILCTCKQAKECKFLNCKTIGTLGQMAITQLNNSYTHKVKKKWKQEKVAFKNIIQSLVHESQQTHLGFLSCFASRLCYTDL